MLPFLAPAASESVLNANPELGTGMDAFSLCTRGEDFWQLFIGNVINSHKKLAQRLLGT